MAGCRMPVVVCRSPKRSCSWFKTVNVVPPKALGCCLGDSKSWSYGCSRKFVWLQSKVRMIAVKSLYDSSRKFVCLLPNTKNDSKMSVYVLPNTRFAGFGKSEKAEKNVRNEKNIWKYLQDTEKSSNFALRNQDGIHADVMLRSTSPWHYLILQCGEALRNQDGIWYLSCNLRLRSSTE